MLICSRWWRWLIPDIVDWWLLRAFDCDVFYERIFLYLERTLQYHLLLVCLLTLLLVLLEAININGLEMTT